MRQSRDLQACFPPKGAFRKEAGRGYREEQNPAVPFDPSGPGGYSYVRLQYLTDSFAEHVKSEENYYYGFDFMFRPYIISMKGHMPDNLTDLIDYTYGDGLSEPPPAVDVYGYGRPKAPACPDVLTD